MNKTATRGLRFGGASCIKRPLLRIPPNIMKKGFAFAVIDARKMRTVSCFAVTQWTAG